MIEGKKGSKPDFLDVDKDGNKKYAIEIVAEDVAASLRFNSVDVQNGAQGGQIAKPKTAAYPAHEDAF